MTVRLTKKRLAALSLAVSLDDVMAEKFRRMYDELDRRQQKIARGESVIVVLRRVGKSKPLERMMIVRQHWTPDGQIVEVV